MPGAPSNVLVTTSKALVTRSDALVPSSDALVPSLNRCFYIRLSRPVMSLPTGPVIFSGEANCDLDQKSRAVVNLGRLWLRKWYEDLSFGIMDSDIWLKNDANNVNVFSFSASFFFSGLHPASGACNKVGPSHILGDRSPLCVGSKGSPRAARTARIGALLSIRIFPGPLRHFGDDLIRRLDHLRSGDYRPNFMYQYEQREMRGKEA